MISERSVSSTKTNRLKVFDVFRKFIILQITPYDMRSLYRHSVNLNQNCEYENLICVE